MSDRTMTFGLHLSGMPQEHSTPTEFFRWIVELTRLARDAGFESVVAGQHMVSAPFQIFQPCPLLARLIPESGDMRLISGVLTLPMLHPIEVAEQFASLDVMSGGRATLGVGLGYRDDEFAAFGVPRSGRARRADEALQIIQALWAGDAVRFSGDVYSIDVPALSIRPTQPGGPPIWYAAMAEKSLRRVRSNGYTPYLGPRIDLGTLREWSTDDSLLGGLTEVPLRRDIFIGTGSSEAIWDEALRHIGPRYDTYREWGLERDTGVSSASTSLRSFLQDHVIVGNPDECVEALAAYPAAGVTHVVLRCSERTLPWPEIRRMLELTAEYVIPAFR